MLYYLVHSAVIVVLRFAGLRYEDFESECDVIHGLAPLGRSTTTTPECGEAMPLSSPRALRRPASPSEHSGWEKVLWRNQPYPDNYVDESFLSSVRSLREYSNRRN
jgi:hypothetical protein